MKVTDPPYSKGSRRKFYMPVYAFLFTSKGEDSGQRTSTRPDAFPSTINVKAMEL